MDEAHEKVTDLRASQGLIEQRILPVKYRSFQSTFNDVVIEWGPAIT
jgi:hypothetical protein